MLRVVFAAALTLAGMHWTSPAPVHATPAHNRISDQRVGRPLAARAARLSTGFTLDATSPVSNALSVPLNTSIALTYSAPISAATVTSRTIAVHSMMQGLVTATHSVNANVVTITPTKPFLPGELVWTSATTGTTDLSANAPSASFVWQFNAGAPAGWGRLNNIGRPFGRLTNTNVNKMAWADFDGDGDPDLAVVVGGQAKVYPNNGDGTFGVAVDVGPSGQNTTCLAWGDFNGDGFLDLAVGNFGLSTGADSYVYPSNGDGTFGTPISMFGGPLPVQSLAWGDVNGDGRLDLAYGLAVYGNYVLLNNGAGGFTGGFGFGGESARDLAWGDFNGDGHLDLAVAIGGWPPRTRQNYAQ